MKKIKKNIKLRKKKSLLYKFRSKWLLNYAKKNTKYITWRTFKYLNFKLLWKNWKIWSRTQRWHKNRKKILHVYNPECGTTKKKVIIPFYKKDILTIYRKNIRLLNKKSFSFVKIRINNKKRLKQSFLEKRVKKFYNKNKAYSIYKLRGYRKMLSCIHLIGKKTMFDGFKYLSRKLPKTHFYKRPNIYEYINAFLKCKQNINKMQFILKIKNFGKKLSKKNYKKRYIKIIDSRVYKKFAEYKKIKRNLVLKRNLGEKKMIHFWKKTTKLWNINRKSRKKIQIFLSNEKLGNITNKFLKILVIQYNALKKLRSQRIYPFKNEHLYKSWRKKYSEESDYHINNPHFFIKKSMFKKKKQKFYKKINRKSFTKGNLYLRNCIKFCSKPKKNKAWPKKKWNKRRLRRIRLKIYYLRYLIKKYRIRSTAINKKYVIYTKNFFFQRRIFFKKRKAVKKIASRVLRFKIWKHAFRKKRKKRKFFKKVKETKLYVNPLRIKKVKKKQYKKKLKDWKFLKKVFIKKKSVIIKKKKLFKKSQLFRERLLKKRNSSKKLRKWLSLRNTQNFFAKQNGKFSYLINMQKILFKNVLPYSLMVRNFSKFSMRGYIPVKRNFWKWFKLKKKIKKVLRKKRKHYYRKIFKIRRKPICVQFNTLYVREKVIHNNISPRLNKYTRRGFMKNAYLWYKKFTKEYRRKKKKWWYVRFRKFPNKKKWHFEKKLRLSWDRLQKSLSSKVYIRKKTWLKKYNRYLFSKRYKNILYRFEMGKIRNFARYTRWYKLKKLNPKRDKKLNKLLFAKKNYIQKKQKAIMVLKPIEFIKHDKTNVHQFIIQKRTYNEGLQFWERYSMKWLRYSLLRHKIVRFYFTPLRTKKLKFMKSRKYIRIYNKLTLFSPRVGTWNTIGLVGNIFGQNTMFSKKKVLLKIFSELYGTKNYKTFRYIGQKYSKTYSNFYTNLNKMLDFFERRIDIIIYRAGFAVNIDIARMLVIRGYIQINGYQKQNPHFHIKTHDFISIIPSARNVIKELRRERYESLRKVYLARFYKPAYFDNMSKYISSIVNLMVQNKEYDLLKNRHAALRTVLLQTSKWRMKYSSEAIYKKELNNNINTVGHFQNTASALTRSNWLWFGKNETTLFKKNKDAKNKIEMLRKVFLKRKYKRMLLMHATSRIIKNKSKYINNNGYNENLYFFKLILKDLSTQNWEKHTRNMLINITCRYVLIYQKFTMDMPNVAPVVINNVRNNLLHFRWLLKNV